MGKEQKTIRSLKMKGGEYSRIEIIITTDFRTFDVNAMLYDKFNSFVDFETLRTFTKFQLFSFVRYVNQLKKSYEVANILDTPLRSTVTFNEIEKTTIKGDN